ncbi:MAG: hypothetical protein RPU40_02915 [Candidatus Sedimenticola sp. (ex Thyasira tokunagai)]
MSKIIQPLSETFLYGSPERVSRSSYRLVAAWKSSQGKKRDRRAHYVPSKKR